MSIEHLSWDSDFFGRSIGRWRTPNIQADNLPDPAGFELIYVEVQETPESTLKAEGWHDAGRKLTFTGPTSSAPVDDAIRTLTHRNTELEELAWLSGLHGIRISTKRPLGKGLDRLKHAPAPTPTNP